MFPGQIQEEKEKKAQETRQKKEKEDSISVGLGGRLKIVSYSPDSSLVALIFAFGFQKFLPSSFCHVA